jgi:hypothetical protein
MNMDNDDHTNNRVWKSYVWYNGNCFFVSTIERTFDTCEGSIRGLETLVWIYDWDKNERGKMIHQAGGIVDHQEICRHLISDGTIAENET